MKRTLLILLSTVYSLTCFCQREVFPIDWEEITKTVEANTDKVKSIVKRMAAPTLDTTLTYEERRLAFYGQSILTEDKEDNLVDEASELYIKGEYFECVNKAKEALEINPLNLQALVYAEHSILKMLKAGDNRLEKNEAKSYYNRAMRIYNTIATTGDGGEVYPFYITKVSDEYNFMRFYCDLWEYESQFLAGNCDVFKLKEISQYYKFKEIRFNTIRPLIISSKILTK